MMLGKYKVNLGWCIESYSFTPKTLKFLRHDKHAGRGTFIDKTITWSQLQQGLSIGFIGEPVRVTVDQRYFGDGDEVNLLSPIRALHKKSKGELL